MNLKLDWYVVTNLKEIRLYSKQTDQFTFERFEIGQLASNDVELRRFVFLLSVERVLQPDGKNHLDDLFVESKKIGRELTAEFYGDYRKLRQDTFDALRQHNPDRDAGELLAATQKLLDRILFIAFCDVGARAVATLQTDRVSSAAQLRRDAPELARLHDDARLGDDFAALLSFVDRYDLTSSVVTNSIYFSDLDRQAYFVYF